MVEAGTYNAKIAKVLDEGREVACVFGESEQKATPFVGCEFVIEDGEAKGQRLPWRGYFSGGALERTIESLLACGFVGDDINTYPEQSPDRTVQIVVEMEDYEDQTRPRVAWVNGPRKVKKLDTTGLKTLGASLKSVIAGQRAAQLADEPKTEAPAADAPKAKTKKAPF